MICAHCQRMIINNSKWVFHWHAFLLSCLRTGFCPLLFAYALACPLLFAYALAYVPYYLLTHWLMSVIICLRTGLCPLLFAYALLNVFSFFIRTGSRSFQGARSVLKVEGLTELQL